MDEGGSGSTQGERDRLQARILIWSVVPLLAAGALAAVLRDAVSGAHLLAVGTTVVVFAATVRALRAGTTGAAATGGMICLLVILGAPRTGQHDLSLLHTGLAPLLLLFVLTFAATRVGRRRGARPRSHEERKGRNAAQVIANLGASGLAAAGLQLGAGIWVYAALLAVLVEATADTVSSEVGQRFGGRPWMLTTLRRVDAGTDGAVSLVGSAAGLLGGALIAGAGMWGLGLHSRQTLYSFAGGVAGWVFDSLLGATAERRGWLGNDLVNFASTVFAGVVAGAFVALL